MTIPKGDTASVELRQRILRIQRLSAMPRVAWQAMEAVGDENVSTGHLERIIQNDPALTSKVLNLANSAYYGFFQTITTVQRAVVAIGLGELKILLMGIGLSRVFDLRLAPPGFDAAGFWLHCLAVSWLAKELARESGHPAPDEVMVAGLLHDLGKLVLVVHLSLEYSEVLRLAEQECAYHEAETRCGLSHPTVGYWLAAKWALPPLHQAVIRHHHGPRPDGPWAQAIALVMLADRLAKTLEMGLAHQAPLIDLNATLQAAGLARDQLAAVRQLAEDKVAHLLDGWRSMIY